MTSVASLALRGCGLGVEHLARDQQIALEAIGAGILQSTCGCTVLAKGEGVPVPFETDMARLLLVNWAKGASASKKTIIKHLRAGSGTVTQKEMDAILVEVDRQIEAKFLSPTTEKTPVLFTGSYKTAKKAALKGHKTKLAFGFADTATAKWLDEHYVYWIGSYYDRFIADALAKQVAAGLEAGLGREAMGKQLAQFFGKYPGVPVRPDHYWRLIAANSMNRSRQFGLIGGYEDAGVRTLEVVAVIDARTSAVCFAPWTPISTESGVKRIDQIVAGEKVLTGSGEYHPVKMSGHRVSRSWVSVRLSSGNLLTVTPEHPILTIHGWKPAGQIQKGDMLALQESSNKDMRELRERVPRHAGRSRPEVLLAGMLSCDSEQGGLVKTGLRSLRQGVPGETLLRKNGANQALQQELPHNVQAEGVDSGATKPRLHSLRNNLSLKADRVSFWQKTLTLFTGMSPSIWYYGLRNLWSGIQVSFLRVCPTPILLCGLLPQIAHGNQTGNVSRGNSKSTSYRVRSRSRAGELLHRFRIAPIRDCYRSGWRLLASTWTQNRTHKEERSSDSRCRVRPNKGHSVRIEKPTGEQSPGAYIEGATGTLEVLDVQHKHTRTPVSAYNLEV